jgi:hypothetical protein
LIPPNFVLFPWSMIQVTFLSPDRSLYTEGVLAPHPGLR